MSPDEEAGIGGTWQWEQCCSDTPIILDLHNDGYLLSGPSVMFDLRANGQPRLYGWPAGSDDAFLALDVDGNGTIDNGRELFGNRSYQHAPASGEARNGFRSLAALDSNDDGIITEADPVYKHLRLWIDANRDGQSQPAELFTLASRGVTSVGTSYKEQRRKDEFGNQFRYKGRAVISGKIRNAYDVILVTER